MQAPLPYSDLFFPGNLMSISRESDTEIPRTPERQGIPEALHPPPVRRTPMKYMARRVAADCESVRRRLDFTDDSCDSNFCMAVTQSSSQADVPVIKRARSEEVRATEAHLSTTGVPPQDPHALCSREARVRKRRHLPEVHNNVPNQVWA